MKLTRTRHAGRKQRRGQALVEFALIVPLLLAMMVGAIDLARVIWSLDSLSNAAREAARYAIVHGGSVGITSGATPATIKSVATRTAVGAAGSLTVFLCYGATGPTTAVTPDSCTADTNTGASSYARGTPVTVVVRTTVSLLSAGLLGLGPFTLTGSALMLVNS